MSRPVGLGVLPAACGRSIGGCPSRRFLGHDGDAAPGRDRVGLDADRVDKIGSAGALVRCERHGTALDFAGDSRESVLPVRSRPQCRVVPEDGLLGAGEFGARLHAEFRHQPSAGASVERQGVGLPAGAVEREHQPCQSPFAQRVLGDQRGQPGRRVVRAAQRQLGRGRRLHRQQPQFLQSGAVGPERAVVAELAEGGAAPQAEGLVQQLQGAVRPAVRQLLPAVGGGAFEAPGVDPLRGDQEAVAGRVVPQDRRPGDGDEPGAQPGEVALQAVERARGRFLLPYRVDQFGDRDGPARSRHQGGQRGPLAGAAEGEDAPVVADLQRSEHAELPPRTVAHRLTSPLC
nr:hypothetical protein [Kitasatospora griseola]